MNWIVSIILIVLITRITVTSIINETSKIKKIMYFFLFVIHFLCFYAHIQILSEIRKDSFQFFQRAIEAKDYLTYLKPGSNFITFIILPFVKIGISYFNLSLLFTTISYYAFNYIYKVAFTAKSSIIGLVVLLFLLSPTLHFWTSGITKEALIFPLMVLIFRDLSTNFKPSVFSIVAITLALFIRPYLFPIIGFSYLITWLITQKKSIKKTSVFVVTFLCFLLISIPIIESFLKIETLNLESAKYIFNKIIDYSSSSGSSSISINQTNYFERIFMVLFRPLFYDSNYFMQHFISFENLFFIILFVFSLITVFKTGIKFSAISFFLFFTGVLIVLFLSTYMYNLGLASRMRVMFMPYFIIAIYFSLNFVESNTTHEKKIN